MEASGTQGSAPGFAAKAKRALIAFVIVDALIVAAVVGLYLGLFRPQQLELERARDRAQRATVAMEVRLHAAEARAAMRFGDFGAARHAAGVGADRLAALLKSVPKDDAAEAKELLDITSRLELVSGEIDRDAETARRDLELVEARLAALYAVPPALDK